jgi:hypothetical protein
MSTRASVPSMPVTAGGAEKDDVATGYTTGAASRASSGRGGELASSNQKATRTSSAAATRLISSGRSNNNIIGGRNNGGGGGGGNMNSGGVRSVPATLTPSAGVGKGGGGVETVLDSRRRVGSARPSSAQRQANDAVMIMGGGGYKPTQNSKPARRASVGGGARSSLKASVSGALPNAAA